MRPTFLTFLRTISYLKPIQFRARFARFFPKRHRRLDNPPRIAKKRIVQLPFIPKANSVQEPDEFLFLNHRATLERNQEAWQTSGNCLLWRYKLHYFDFLHQKHVKDLSQYNLSLIFRWIDQNRAGVGIGWEPYPCSLRIVNWVKFLVSNSEIYEEIEISLAHQINWLSQNLEWHLLGNHLFANGKALVVAGCVYNGALPDLWLKKGLEIIDKEIDEQILEDGANFELSPMYHAIMLEDLLEILYFLQEFKPTEHASRKPKFEQKINSMLRWLDLLTHKDGCSAHFNDVAIGEAPRLEELLDLASKLGIVPDLKTTSRCQWSEKSGYARVSQDRYDLYCDLADVGASYQPGHAHADTLSFELSINGRRVFVNGGTSTYETGLLRHEERSTKSHNTVVVQQQNSSEVWASFRVGRRANVRDVNIEETDRSIRIVATHDGYMHLRPGCLHTREWVCGTEEMTITDVVSPACAGSMVHFLLHPNIDIQEVETGVFRLSFNEDICCEMILTGGTLVQGYYSEGFGKRVETRKLQANISGASLTTVLRFLD